MAHRSYGNPLTPCVLTCGCAYSAIERQSGDVAVKCIGALSVALMLGIAGEKASAQADSPTGLGYIAPMAPRQVPRDDWHDKAPHRAFGVDVAPGVRIHVLDFGGTGTPLVFLSGLSNNAHVWDDFGQRFTGSNRVIAITRRGFGESSHPDDGYDQPTLAKDVITVLDSMKVDKAIFAGHSHIPRCRERPRFRRLHPEGARERARLDRRAASAACCAQSAAARRRLCVTEGRMGVPRAECAY
jgi:hypothetical protein